MNILPTHGIRGTLHHLQFHLPHRRFAPRGIHARRAALLGIEAIAIADENSVAGDRARLVGIAGDRREIADRAEAMKDPIGPPKPAYLPDPPRADLDHIPRLIPAAWLHLREGLHLTALPRDRTGWARLCRLLSVGRLRAEKGQCILHLDDLLGHGGWS
jgi:DNA polymerase III alpha subunit